MRRMVNFRKENYLMRIIKRYSLLTFFGLTFVISLTGFILDIPRFLSLDLRQPA